MSSATVRPKGGRRQDGGYQSFPNSNQNRTSKNKWNNNVQHTINNAPRSQTIPQTTQPSANHHNNSNNTTPSGTNSLKPIELVHDEVSANHVNHMHDRMLFLLSNFVGINVVVTVRSGAKYQGLFHAAHTEGELGVILKLARKVATKPEEKNLPNCPIPVFILPHKEVMEIHACGVDFSASLEKPLNEREGFRTDTDISGRTEVRERELHKWASEESGETMKGLEDDINPDSSNASWDQFAANEKLFGIKTDFNEELYTTKLDRTGADFKERERQAIAIANEITRTSTTNIHMLEERGYLVEDNQMDEEERYGAVMRNRDPSKYMPPPLRKLQEQQQLQQHGAVPVIKKPETVKEPIKDTKTKQTEEPKNIKPVPPPSAAPVPPSPSLPKDNNSLLSSPLASFKVESDVSPINPHNPKKPDTDADGKPIEAVIMKTFRKFANHEKERLQQRKQAIFKKEMDGRVAELLKWGQSFKLNSPLPKDLIPILTKDETKRQQLVAKSEAAMSEKDNDKEKEKLKEKEEKQDSEKGKEKDDDKPKEKTTPTPNADVKTEFSKPIIKIEEEKSPQSNAESKSVPENVTAEKPTSAADKAPPQHPPSKTPATTPANTQFKLNAKASEWKPNPNAASFTPTPSTNGDKRSPGSSPFFGNRQLKKNSASLKDGFSPFKKGKSPDPNSIPPTWPFGQKPFRHHFTVTTNYEEDIYTQASVNQGFGFTAYPVAPYRFTTGTQFVGVPPMPIQQTTPMQYMPGFVPGMPFTTAPMPPNGAPPTIYSPQIPPVIPQHFGSQGFPSPGRTPMVPTGMHPQMYPPYQNPHGLPPMMRYPHEIVPHVPPAGVMMSQRPMVMEQHYETAPMEVMPVSDQTTTQ